MKQSPPIVRLPEPTPEREAEAARVLAAWIARVRESGEPQEDARELAKAFGVPLVVVRRAIGRGELAAKVGRSAWERWIRALETGQAGAGSAIVYFIEDGDLIKIGSAKRSAEARAATLATGNPRELRLLGTMAGTSETERALHRRFRDLRTRGEWFRASVELLAFIAEHAERP